jgi:hypothetical protein
MSDIRAFIDGRRFSAASPFRSLSFMVASILGLGAVGLDVYLIFRHLHTAPAYVAMILSIPIGVQLIYQWWRALRCCKKVQELRLNASDGRSPVDSAVQVAVSGMLDVLFFSYGINLSALILIGLLLSSLDHL